MMWKCGKFVEISGKWYKLDILRGKDEFYIHISKAMLS